MGPLRLTQAPHFTGDEYETLFYFKSHGQLVAGPVSSSDSHSTSQSPSPHGGSLNGSLFSVGMRHSRGSLAPAFFQP